MPVIAFEGLDGVGKTSMAHEVALAMKGIDARAFVLPGILKVERQWVNRGTDVEARFNYFTRLNEAQMDMARRFSKDGFVVTLDSSIHRTIATHRVLGSLAAQAYETPPDLCPDVTYLIELDETERIARLMARDGGLKFASEWDKQLYNKQAELREAYADFHLPVLDGLQPIRQLRNEVASLVEV